MAENLSLELFSRNSLDLDKEDTMGVYLQHIWDAAIALLAALIGK